MNQLSRICLLQISVLVYVTLIVCAAPHDSNESLSSVDNPSSAHERIPPGKEQQQEGHDIMQRVAKQFSANPVEGAKELAGSAGSILNFYAYLTMLSSDTEGAERDLSLPVTEEQEGYDIVQRLAKRFSINFFKKIARNLAEAAVLSPLSFFIPLSMLSYGAEGAERDLFLSAIGLRKNETRIAEFGYKRLLNTLSHYNMKVSTKVYYTDDLTPIPSFTALAKDVFKTDLEPVSVDDAYISNAKVNDWVKNQTNNETAELFKAPLKIGPKPSVVLVNTVYFKGAWQSPFDSSLTTQRPFHILDGDAVNVPTMHKYGRMPYGRIDAMQSGFVELPFQTTSASDPMSMFIILPDEKQWEVNWIVGQLDKFDWENLRHTTMRNVNLYLPKFKFESFAQRPGSGFDYVLGAANPFKTHVSLTNMMTPSKSMSFGNSAMKFVIEVNEDGDTTTGSSGGYYKNETERVNRKVRDTGVEPDVEFDANHTFLAIIATKGKVFQDIAIINFNGFPFMPRNAVMWGVSEYGS